MATVFSERFKNARIAKGISRVDLALEVDLHYGMIGNYERGESTPGSESLGKLAKVMGVSVDYLLGIPENEDDESVSDRDLLALFKKIEKLSKHKKYVIKYFITAFVFKAEVEDKLSEIKTAEFLLSGIEQQANV